MTHQNHLLILGSTGSIGTQSIQSALHLGLKIDSLSANSNSALLEEQLRLTGAKAAAMTDEEAAKDLMIRTRDLDVKIYVGKDAAREIAAESSADTAINAITGFAGMMPTIEAIKSRKNVALANKETLVAAGEIVMPLAKQYGVTILPIDSEHCAIHQCLSGNRKEQVKRLIITASGGPFFGYSKEQLKTVTPEMALRHPNWSMGSFLTVYSATLANKGLEMIEATRLFDMSEDKIDVIINRESIIHSMVEFVDGSVLAQMATPDMRLCIQYALTYPEKLPGLTKTLDLAKIGALHFYNIDNDVFPALETARRAARLGGVATAVFNAANEISTGLFLEGKLPFDAIFSLIESAVTHFGRGDGALTAEKIIDADRAARDYVHKETNL